MSGHTENHGDPVYLATCLDDIKISTESKSDEAKPRTYHYRERGNESDEINESKGPRQNISQIIVLIDPSTDGSSQRDDDMPRLRTSEFTPENGQPYFCLRNIFLEDNSINDLIPSATSSERQLSSSISNVIESKTTSSYEDIYNMCISVDQCDSVLASEKISSNSDDLLAVKNLTFSSILENKGSKQGEAFPTLEKLPGTLNSKHKCWDECNGGETCDENSRQENSKCARPVLVSHPNGEDCTENSKLLSNVRDEKIPETSRVTRRQLKPRACSSIRRIQEKLQEDLVQSQAVKEPATMPSTSSSLNYMRRQRSRSRASACGRAGSSLIQRPYRRWLGVSTNIFADARYIVSSTKKSYSRGMCNHKSSIPNEKPTLLNENPGLENEAIPHFSGEVKTNPTCSSQNLEDPTRKRSAMLISTNDVEVEEPTCIERKKDSISGECEAEDEIPMPSSVESSNMTEESNCDPANYEEDKFTAYSPENSQRETTHSPPVDGVFFHVADKQTNERRKRDKHHRHRHAHQRVQHSHAHQRVQHSQVIDTFALVQNKEKPDEALESCSSGLRVPADDSFRQDGGLAGSVVSVPQYEFMDPPSPPSLSDEERRYRQNRQRKAVPFDGTNGIHPLREELKQYLDLGLHPSRTSRHSRSFTLEKLMQKSWKKESGKPEYYHVQAIRDFNGKLPGQLSFKKEQVIKQLDTGLLPKNGMSYGYYKTGRLRRKKAGLYPCSYVTCQVND